MVSYHHPAIEDVTVEGILYAFADPVRLQIYLEIAEADCPQICASFLNMQGKSLPKSTLSQHFKVLRAAGLIKSERSGVTLKNTTRCAELRGRFGPLIESILTAYKDQHTKTHISSTS